MALFAPLLLARFESLEKVKGIILVNRNTDGLQSMQKL